MGSQSSKPTTTNTMTLETNAINEKKAYLDERKRSAAADALKNIDHAVADADVSSGVDASSVNKWDQEFENDPTFKLSTLILSQNDPVTSLKSRPAIIADQKIFNVTLKGIDDKGAYPGPVTNQASSGRCWLFATTNVLRYNVVEQLKLGDFQLSQNYLFFYDKIEKANYYLENMIELVDEPVEGRLISFLNSGPVSDGGQWDMAYNLLDKYGVIPQAIYPDSFSATASSKMGYLITHKLREYGLILREAARPSGDAQPASVASLRKLKEGFLREIYKTLCISLGTPPKADEKVTWEYYDKENKFHSWTGTPKEFYAQYCKRKGMDPKDSFSLINDPRNEYGKHFTVKRLGNVWNGPGVRYVNAPTEVLEDAVIAGIKANTPLFFGCDVGKFSVSDKGIMDTSLFDIEAAYGYKLGMDKAQRLRTGESAATHAMVITAVHVDEKTGRPIKYKVENSWDKKAGEDGWFMMSAEWFRQYVYQIVAPKSIVPKKWVDVLDQEPASFEPWDPMGALA